MVSEFLLMVGDEVFRVYSKDKESAIETFIKACKQYGDVSNEGYRDYWCELSEAVKGSKYQIVEVYDFIGVRKI